jgi:hypothetical protein
MPHGRWAAEPGSLLTTLRLPYSLRRMCGLGRHSVPDVLVKLHTDTFAAVLWIRLDPLK